MPKFEPFPGICKGKKKKKNKKVTLFDQRDVLIQKMLQEFLDWPISKSGFWLFKMPTFNLVTFDLQAVEQCFRCWWHWMLEVDNSSTRCPHCMSPSTYWLWGFRQTHGVLSAVYMIALTYQDHSVSLMTASKLTVTAKFSLNTWCVLDLWGLSNSSLDSTNLRNKEWPIKLGKK